jgi:signal transduction histidine kinase/ActR/RegA family two-component response regulator
VVAADRILTSGRAEAQERELRARQSAMAELSRMMLGSVDQPALERVCEHVRQRLDVDYSLFLELDANTRELRLRAGQAWAVEAIQQLAPIDGPVVVTDYALTSRHEILASGIRSGIVVPVGTGILTAHSRIARAYSEDDVAFMQTLANILAAGLERHRALHEQRKLESQLEQANRIAGLGRLAATIAHEFNNVLMGVAPFVEVMRRGKNIESSLDHISRAVARGRRITQDILRYTQPAEPSRTPIDLELWLQTISHDARSLLSPASTIDVHAGSDHLFIDGDPSQLQQVFTNLILNARDAMPGGGRVTIELRHDDEGARLPFAIEHPELYAHFVVRDTGCGMTAEMLRHVFEPLFTTKRNGTGLGLPVALQVVQRHGGEMFVESAPGVGTAFHIFLPLSAPVAPVRAPEPAPAPAPKRTPAKRILLVEDDTTVALGLVLLLELEGMQVRVARTGEEALAILDRERPDVVILDMGLPDMEGTQVFDAFAKRYPHLPVIFSTGDGDRTKIESLLARPNVGFLVKPYNHATLLDTITEVTKKAKAA